jgi:hypothetical protein
MNLINNISSFFFKIKKVFKWIPIIWRNSYDWDSSFAINIFREKLSEMVTYFESSDATTEDAKFVTEKIKTAIRIMDKLSNDEYLMDALKKIEDKYGKYKFVFKPCENNCYEMVREWEQQYTEEELKDIEEYTKKVLVESYKKCDHANQLLWSFIAFNINKWS